ncbi:unnamed protein product [Lota lota]
MELKKGIQLIYLNLMLFHATGSALNCTSPSPESLFDALKETLFSKNQQRPVKKFGTATNVSVSFILVGILGVNEKAQTLTTFLWLLLEWDIEDLSWDEKECGTQKVPVKRENLWIPDIFISEFMDENQTPFTPYIYLDNKGHVYDDKPIRVVSSCNLGMTKFPFDVQNCTLSFGSYIHYDSEIHMVLGRTAEVILQQTREVLQTEGEWELLDITAAESSLYLNTGGYQDIVFNVVIKRRPVLYVVNLLIPSSFLMLIDILSFYLPPHSVDRASFKMTLILGYTVFLLIMNDLLPSTANGTPIIGIYFSVCLALMVISLLETVIITNVLHHNSMKYREVPRWVRVLVLKHIANLICYRWPEEIRSATLPSNDKPDKPESDAGICSLVVADVPELRQICQDVGQLRAHLTALQKEGELQDVWCHVGYVLDFLLFRVYLLLISFYALVIIYMWCIWVRQT